MDPRVVRPETLEERLVYWAIAGTWGLWLLGALYVTGPLIGIVLLAIAAARCCGLRDDHSKRPVWVPIGVIIWIVGMGVMLLALVIAHFDFELGMAQLVKSTIGWAKGWALLAIFPLAGAVLAIRPAVIYRASCLLAMQTLVLAPFFFAAGHLGLPSELYTSPLAIVGGPGKEFFDVTLYHIDDTDNSMRWRFFGPWATAVAFYASIGFLVALYDRAWLWRGVGIVSAVVVCWMTGSRSSIVALPVVICAVLVLSNLTRPQTWLLAAIGVVGVALFVDQILGYVEETREAFNAARAASSRVRATLNHIGYYRWYTEAYWFGHGIVERGPHLVEFMPIGSHHTWYGLLYVKGAVGFAGLAVPLLWSAVDLTLKAQRDRVARCALSVVFAIALFSFADNLEIVTYLIWPGLLVIGIGLRRPFASPFAAPLEGRREPAVSAAAAQGVPA